MKIKWKEQDIIKESLKYLTRNDFAKKSPNAYEAARRRNILDKACGHMRPSKSKAYSEIELREEALKYNTRGDFAKNSKGFYYAAMRNGILEDICAHMDYVNNYRSDEDLKIEAQKYITRSEFKNKNGAAYAVALFRGILDIICAHMEYAIIYWTVDSLKIEAQKYKNRTDFKIHSPKAYYVAQKRGFLKDICSHMNPSKGISKEEKIILKIIKNIYPDAKKLRDMSVKIKDKPYIKGFDIDIFVDILNKGIEFDGKYHHSFEFMRKDPKRSKWSDSDIRDYHEIKDAWFASKGIQILHIKEEDWIKNNQECIDKCLIFLKNKH